MQPMSEPGGEIPASTCPIESLNHFLATFSRRALNQSGLPNVEAYMVTSTAVAPEKNSAHVEAITWLAHQRKALVDQISKAIVGQRDVLENVLLTIFCGGHALIVG